MILYDNGRMQLKVYGAVFGLTTQDYGTYWKVRVYQDGKVIGFKDYPIRVELTQVTFEWIVRSILKGRADETATP
jgi:hypothetical protein